MKWRDAVTAGALAIVACLPSDTGIPEGKLAVVGEVELGPEDVASVKSQLGAYAQLRFVGEEGQFGLLEAVVDAELLAQEAVEHGLGDDPRVRYALLEEIAEVQRSAALQRAVPFEDVAADEAALREYYEAHRDAFVEPEQRSAEGVPFRKFDKAEAAFEEISAGAKSLEDFGQLVGTKSRTRSDDDFPGFHPFLFDPALGEGELFTRPVILGSSVLVGRVKHITPAKQRELEDDEVRERVLQAVRAPRAAEARARLEAELRDRFPIAASP